MNMKKIITGFTIEEFTEDFFLNYDEPAYRAKQIYQNAVSGNEPKDMSNIPKALREKLSSEYVSVGMRFIKKYEEKRTATTKYLLSTQDEILIECVALIYEDKLTVCVSTQAGCRMGCAFCASGEGGLIRNLTAGEMISQLSAVSSDMGLSVHNVVLMGSGEPLDNYDEVKKFILLMTDERALNIGKRHITLSTCGIEPMIRKLADDGLGVNLSLSLHAAIPNIRSGIMPVQNAYPVEKVIEACNYYRQKTSRRITCEYCVIEGVNDTDECAHALKKLIDKTDIAVNLIDYNKKDNYLNANKGNCADEFANKLKKLKITCTIRRKLGSGINAACGQLKSRYMAAEEE